MEPEKERWAPRVTVAAVIENDGRFLLVEECIDGQRYINQPAGHLDPGESLIEAVIRETLEETGRHFQPTAVIGVYRWVHPQNGLTFLRHCFTGSVSPQEDGRELDPAILRTLWLDQVELNRRHKELRSPLVARCIEDYLQGKRYPVELYRDVIN